MYKQTIGDIKTDLQVLAGELNTPQARQAHKEYELSKYTTQELKDELASREEGSHYECDLDVTDPDHWYCAEHDVEGSY